MSDQVDFDGAMSLELLEGEDEFAFFQPLFDLDVLCDRHHFAYNSPGTRFARHVIVTEFLDAFALERKRNSTHGKSRIMDAAIERIRFGTPSNPTVRHFYRKDKETQTWIMLGDEQIRHCVGHWFRQELKKKKLSSTRNQSRKTTASRAVVARTL